MPTKNRGLTSMAIRREGELFLFDCAEGTQRQMTHTNISPMNVDVIFITHYHGDHFLGIPGLVQTMSLMDRERDLKIYGPEGTEERISKLLQTPVFSLKFKIEIQNLSPGDVIRREDYRIKTASMDHSAPGIAYALIEDERPGRFYPEKAKELDINPGPKYSQLQDGESIELDDGTTIDPEQVMGPPRPGRKIVFSGDTRPSKDIIELAKDADILIHDATFGSDLEKEASEGGHSTAAEAAGVAKRAGVEKLLLTHPSPRYSDTTELKREAKEIFSNSVFAEDFMEIEVDLKN
ncbi:hypothetical protein AKJ52_02220 [candidate division MSBL1 archaeon SCGC-AAA382C18]|uniref:Ribonuclease Z n=1 Tax=candidate division MSBL1 archaeon SCGC-AAA382C18 TaxID=1698281 RepID=A0A133VJ28_9EURY|nr:hypothetical protein AKJ52_02220 [candidate division MSBL1 archaeon SCGC-AAA382C18]